MKRAPNTGTIAHITNKELRKPYMARVTIETYYDENGKKKDRKKCLGYFATFEDAEQAINEYIDRKNNIKVEKNEPAQELITKKKKKKKESKKKHKHKKK